MEGGLEREINEGVRYVVAYKGVSQTFYFSKPCTKEGEADVKARAIIKDMPNIAEKLSVVKVKPVGPGYAVKGLPDVMVWTKNPRFLDLENIYVTPGKAKSAVGKLKDDLIISLFSTEVVKTYENESRA